MIPTLNMRKSRILYEKARNVSPGGVHDELRYMEPHPIFFKKAKGSRIYDVDGNEYLDFHLAFGPVILGHCNPKVVRAVEAQAETGDLWGAGAYEQEFKLSEKISRQIPSAEMVRLCNAGSDATYHAIRLARAYTKRKKILKFEGCYHGWHDYVAISVTPPADRIGTIYPQSDGMLAEAVENTMVVPFNDIEVLEKTVKEHKSELAAVISEPIMHNVGCIMPKDGYLKAMREVTEQNDVLLILDEVITGFRHGLGGVQKIFGVTPDITTIGKAMANGYPIAAVCGRKHIMSQLRPTGNVYMAATYYSHPIAVAAAVATISELESGKVHNHIFGIGEIIRKGLSKIVQDLDLKAQVVGFKSIFWVYFTDENIRNYASLLSNDVETFMRYNQGMRESAIFFVPHHLKRCHVSAAHTKRDAQKFLSAAEKTLNQFSRKD